MRTTVISYGCPEWSLTQAALADMRDEIYGLPIWAFAGASDSKVMDAQAGAEAMFSILTAMQSRCNVIHDVGYLEFGTTSSLEMLVMADELVAMSRSFHRRPCRSMKIPWRWMSSIGWRWEAEQSIFLTDDHTMKHFRQAHFHPRLLDRHRYEAWKDAGRRRSLRALQCRGEEDPFNHEVKPKPADVLAEIEDILDPPRKKMAV